MSETTRLKLNIGDHLMKQNDPNPDKAYMVLSGKLEIYTEVEGKKQHIAYAGRGQIVGELALIDKSPRSASIVAVEPSECDSMQRTTFEACLKQSNPFIVALLRVLSGRYRALIKKLDSNQSNIF